MLKGLEVSEIRFSDLLSDLRIDAETYRPFYLDIETKIQQREFSTLGAISSKIKKGIFDIKSDSYTNSGVPFVRISNLRNMGISISDIAHIPESENHKNLDTFLERGDIILSKTAYPAASIVQIENCNTSQDTVAVKIKKEAGFDSSFVVAFLNTRYGHHQMRRWFTGNIQMHLNLNDCKGILIPKASNDFQDAISKLVWASFELDENSERTYEEAEALLLSSINLQNLDSTADKFNVKSFKESFLKSGRLDAEYYQTKFDRLEKALGKTKCSVKLGTLLKMNKRGTQPFYTQSDAGLTVLNSKHIRENYIDFTDNRRADVNRTKDSLIIKRNDVLLNGTGVGTIGRTAPYLGDEPLIPDNHVTILRTTDIDPIFLSVQLNSIIGKLQVEKYFKGSSGQIELYPADIDQFLVWNPSGDIQMEVRNKIETAKSLKDQSLMIVDKCKLAIELAIDKDEHEAFRLLQK